MYDFLVETLYALYRNGFSVTAIGAVAYVLLRQRRVKKRLKQYIPWLFEDESEVKGYIQNQHTIMENQKLIMERMGIECHVPMLKKSSKDSAQKSVQRSPWHWTTLSTARDVGKYTHWRGKIMKKFKSRKFIIAVVGAILIVLNDGLDLGIDSNTVLAFAGLLATWIVGEAAVDAKRAGKEDTPGDTGPAE